MVECAFHFISFCVFRCESVKSFGCCSSKESLHLLQLILLGYSLCSCWNLPGFTFDKDGKCRLRWVRVSWITGCQFRSLKRDWALVYTFLKLRLLKKWAPSPEHKISTSTKFGYVSWHSNEAWPVKGRWNSIQMSLILRWRRSNPHTISFPNLHGQSPGNEVGIPIQLLWGVFHPLLAWEVLCVIRWF